MTPQAKPLILEALRSGRYTQSVGQRNNPTTGSLCVMGVVADIYAKNSSWLTDKTKLIGLSDWCGCFSDKVTINGQSQILVDHNDNGRTFLEIADAIESQL